MFFNRLKNFFNKYQIQLIIAGFPMSIFLDRAFAFEMSEEEHLLLRKIAGILTDAALGIYWISGILLFALCLYLFRRFNSKKNTLARFQNLQAWIFHFILSLTTTGIVAVVVKFLIGRERPHFDEQHVLSFHPFSVTAVHQSFPSGHTQVIFCVAAMFCYLFPKQRWSFLFVAAVIAITRAITLNHFISDVYAGAIIGGLGCRLTVTLFSSWIQEPKPIFYGTTK